MTELRKEILTEMNVKPSIDPAEELQNRVAFMRDYLSSTGMKGFVLGISGGQDSLLAGYVAQRTVEEARADGEEVSFTAMLLPYGEQKDRADAVMACDFIGPDNIRDYQIKPAVDAFEDTFNKMDGDSLSDFDKGNVKARTRMMAQYAVARESGLLVIGTDHAAEAVTGFFTKYGDGAADVLPLSGLNKRQGKEILRFIGAPERFMVKAPSADLLDGNPRQADEFELGITYDDIDDYLEGKEVSDAAAEAIEARFVMTRHKRDVPVAYGA